MAACKGGCGESAMPKGFQEVTQHKIVAQNRRGRVVPIKVQGASKGVKAQQLARLSRMVNSWKSEKQVDTGFGKFSEAMHRVMANGTPRQITALYDSVAPRLVTINRDSGMVPFFTAIKVRMGIGMDRKSKMAALFLAMPAMANPTPSFHSAVSAGPVVRHSLEAAELDSLFLVSRVKKSGDIRSVDAGFAPVSDYVRIKWMTNAPQTASGKVLFFKGLKALYMRAK